MKKKRLLLIVGGMAAFVGLTLGVLALLPPKPGVTKENYDRIEVGMTRGEVEQIFGGPANRFQPWVAARRLIERASPCVDCGSA